MKKTLALVFAILFVFVTSYAFVYEISAVTFEFPDCGDTIGGYNEYGLIQLLLNKEQYIQWMNGTLKATATDKDGKIIDVYDIEVCEKLRDVMHTKKIYSISINGVTYKREPEILVYTVEDLSTVDVCFHYTDLQGKQIVWRMTYLSTSNKWYNYLGQGTRYFWENTFGIDNEEDVSTIKLRDRAKDTELEVEVITPPSAPLGSCIFTYEDFYGNINYSDLANIDAVFDVDIQTVALYDCIGDFEYSAEVKRDVVTSEDLTSDDIVPDEVTSEDSVYIESSVDGESPKDDGSRNVLIAVITVAGALAVCAVVLLIIFKPKKKEE